MGRVGIIGSLLAIGLTGSASYTMLESNPPAISCTADSGKAFSSALTPDMICDRFMRSIGNKSGTVRVELRFLANGVASAKIWQLREGQWTPLPLFEMAVMDRPFSASDIDRMAQDVAQWMAVAPKTEG
jgi:hypothetical protein